MNQKKKVELWKEIIATAEDKDPQYSYRLFSETIDKVEEGVKKGCGKEVKDGFYCGEYKYLCSECKAKFKECVKLEETEEIRNE